MRLPFFTLVLPLICALSASPARAVDPSAFASGASTAQITEQIEQARLALAADKAEEAGKIMENVLKQAAFAEADSGIQAQGLRIAAYAAAGRNDALAAHEFFLLVSEFPDANADDWAQLTYASLALDQYTDAATSLATLVKRWPGYLDTNARFARELVGWDVGGLTRGKNQTEKRALLEVLFAANYTSEYGSEHSSYWRELAEAAIERGDLPGAGKFAARITDPSTLVAMHIDKRFDALIAKDPRAFDVRAAADREVNRRRAFVAKNPRTLGGPVQLTYALYTVGRFAEMLEVCDAAIGRIEKPAPGKPAYDDLEHQQNWIYNQKATALWALGRRDDALAVMAAGAKTSEAGSSNVSQAINLASYYNDAGRPQDALAGLEGVDWVHGLSPYGRMQLQAERYSAYLQLANAGEADAVLAWVREHHADAQETAQYVLLQSGDEDGAAALLIARLRDATERASALLEVQDFNHIAQSERTRGIEQRRQHMIARADVVAAIGEFGRREKFPIWMIAY